MPTHHRIVPAALALLLVLPLIPRSVAFAANTITASPNPLPVCVGGKGTFTAKDGNNTVSATSQSPSIATVSAAGNNTFTVTGQSAGTDTINLTDASNIGTEQVNVNGPLSVSSGSSLTFDGTRSDGSGTAPQTFTVSDLGPATTVTATLAAGAASFSNTSVVLTSQKATVSGQAQFTVYPVGSSTASSAATSIALSDLSGCSVSNAVSVTVIPGALSLSASSLNFSALGSGNSKIFTASEYDYTGALTATSSNTSVATVSPATTPAPGAAKSVTYTVTPVNYGKSTISVSDVRPSSQSVSVLVSGGTISIPMGSSHTASFATINDNTNQHLAATPIRITGSVETTASGGANIYVLSPGDIIGSGGDVLKIAYLTYNCTSNDSSKNQGGSFATGFLALIANTAAANCLTFGNAGGTGQYADIDLNVNLFLDDRTVPADTYTTGSGQNNPFQVVLSAT